MMEDEGQMPVGCPVAPLLLHQTEDERRWARISRRYMAEYLTEYRKGADGCEAIRAVKAHGRHRDTNDSRSREVEAAMASMF